MEDEWGYFREFDSDDDERYVFGNAHMGLEFLELIQQLNM